MVPVEINNTRLILVQGSVADQEVDAVVNAANMTMRCGGGVYGFPIERAAPLAVSTVAEYVTNSVETKLLRVVFAMCQTPPAKARWLVPNPESATLDVAES